MCLCLCEWGSTSFSTSGRGGKCVCAKPAWVCAFSVAVN